jgi:hypothetical protein
MSVVVVISQHLLNVFVQLANKRGFKKKIRVSAHQRNWQQHNQNFQETLPISSRQLTSTLTDTKRKLMSD